MTLLEIRPFTSLLTCISLHVGLRDEAEQVDKMRQLLAELPTPNFTLLSWLFVHLDHVMAKVCKFNTKIHFARKNLELVKMNVFIAYIGEEGGHWSFFV